MEEPKPHSVPPEIEGALVELGSDPESSVSIREADEVRDYIERLVEQLESLRSDYARLRATLMAIEDMPVRIQFGNKLAENPAITHDGAARALRETQDSFGQVSSLAKTPYVYSGDVNDPGPHSTSELHVHEGKVIMNEISKSHSEPGMSDFEYVRAALRRLNPEMYEEDFSWTALQRIEKQLEAARDAALELRGHMAYDEYGFVHAAVEYILGNSELWDKWEH